MSSVQCHSHIVDLKQEDYRRTPQEAIEEQEKHVKVCWRHRNRRVINGEKKREFWTMNLRIFDFRLFGFLIDIGQLVKVLVCLFMS